MLPMIHGTFPTDELVPVARLMLARSGTGNLWGRLTETVRVFLFPKPGEERARLAFLSREDTGWHTLCELTRHGEGWRGVFGLGFVKVKKNPRGDRNYDSWNLYLSPFYGEAA